MELFLIRLVLLVVLLIPVSIFGLYVYNGIIELSKKPKKQIAKEAKDLFSGIIGLVLITLVGLALLYVLYPLLLTVNQVARPYLHEFWELFRYNQSHIKI